MEKNELNEWKKVGALGAEVLVYAKSITKPETPLLEIAEKVEDYVRKKKLAFAFPINLSTENAAAHYSPIKNDEMIAKGLIKIDIGVMQNGFISDSAISVDLTPENKFKELIKASEDGLKAGIKEMKFGNEIRNVGKAIHEAIAAKGFEPIRNLSGHKMEVFDLHAGQNIPNYDNKEKTFLKEGIYAVEPFATTGAGLVKEGKPSNIYVLENDKPTRLGRDVLKFIKKEFKTLPFSSRWVTDKFGPGAKISLERLKQQDILHHFPQLINEPGKFTSQAEHTLAVLEDKTLILTKSD